MKELILFQSSIKLFFSGLGSLCLAPFMLFIILAGPIGAILGLLGFIGLVILGILNVCQAFLVKNQPYLIINDQGIKLRNKELIEWGEIQDIRIQHSGSGYGETRKIQLKKLNSKLEIDILVDHIKGMSDEDATENIIYCLRKHGIRFI